MSKNNGRSNREIKKPKTAKKKGLDVRPTVLANLMANKKSGSETPAAKK